MVVVGSKKALTIKNTECISFIKPNLQLIFGDLTEVIETDKNLRFFQSLKENFLIKIIFIINFDKNFFHTFTFSHDFLHY